MESYFGLVAAVVIVIILALGLAIISNRAEEVKEVVQKKKTQRNGRDAKKDKTKTRRGNPKKPVVDVFFGSKDGGQDENEDQSMIELIQGTAKQVAKDAKEELKKKIQSDKVIAERQKQNNKPQNKKKGDDKEDDNDYVIIKSRKAKPAQDSEDAPAQVDQAAKGQGKKAKKGQQAATSDSSSTATNGETPAKAADSVPAAGGSDAQRRKNKAFLKTELPPERKPGEKRPPREPRERRVRPEGENFNLDTDNAGANGENPRPPRQPRNRPRENEEVDPNAPVVEGEERRRQPREPREPREPRKPREIQPLPAPLLAAPADTPSLDDMLGALSSFYGQKNFFSGIPKTSLIAIAQYLSAKDVVALSRVNNFLNKVTRDNEIWKALCQRDFGLKFGKSSDRKKFKLIYRDEFEKAHGKKPSATSERRNERERKPREAAGSMVEAVVDAVVPTEEAKPKVDKKPREKKPKDV